jgi:DNA-binding NtrC family response regulator
MIAADRTAGGGRRVLVIEDEYLIAVDIALTLEGLGYAVVGPVSTVGEALAVIAGEALDAVLLDTNLGGTSSEPIAVELNRRHLPFVVVTGYGNLPLAAADLDSALRVNKPFTPDELAGTLASAMGRDANGGACIH